MPRRWISRNASASCACWSRKFWWPTTPSSSATRSPSTPRSPSDSDPPPPPPEDRSPGGDQNYLLRPRRAQSAAGQRLPAPAGSGDGRGGPPDGALCRRLRGAVSQRSRGPSGLGAFASVGRGQRARPASRQDARGPLSGTGPGLRVPGLPLRGGSALRAQEQSAGAQGAGPAAHAAQWRPEPGARDRGTSTRCCAAGSRTSSTPTKRIFSALDGSIRQRLWALPCKQARRPGAGDCAADHHRWPNAFFAAHGLFTLLTAHDLARQPNEECTSGKPSCGRTACRVRREGTASALPSPNRVEGWVLVRARLASGEARPRRRDCQEQLR